MLDLELMYSIIGCAGFGWAGGMPDCQRVDRRASGRKGYFDAQIPICTTAQMTKVCKKHKFIIEFLLFKSPECASADFLFKYYYTILGHGRRSSESPASP